MTNHDWITYTGSDEQIAEILQSELFVVDSRFSIFKDPTKLSMPVTSTYMTWLRELLENGDVKQYRICQPHPLSDMICQQARTGQKVWVKFTSAKFVDNDRYEFMSAHKCYSVYVTTRPDWNIPEAKYSFTPFEEEPCK